MIKQVGKFNIDKIKRDFEKIAKTILPKQLGSVAVDFFDDNFKKQGFVNQVLDPWKRRKGKRKRETGRAILVDSGALRKSIRVKTATFRRIMITSSGLNYAKFHNEGTDRLPKRQFMGDSIKLDKKLRLNIERQINKIIKKHVR